jgi:hypothetical protein
MLDRLPRFDELIEFQEVPLPEEVRIDNSSFPFQMSKLSQLMPREMDGLFPGHDLYLLRHSPINVQRTEVDGYILNTKVSVDSSYMYHRPSVRTYDFDSSLRRPNPFNPGFNVRIN